MKRLLPLLIVVFLVACQPEITGELTSDEVYVDEIQVRSYPREHNVNINGSRLDPKNISIKTGDRITFTNINAREYKIQEESYRMFESPYLRQGSSYTHTFSKPGTYTIEILDEDLQRETSRRDRWPSQPTKATIEVM